MTVIDQVDPNAEKPKRKRTLDGRQVAVHRAAPPVAANPMTVVERAIEKGLTGQDLKELMDLQERWEAGQARKAFDLAMAEAQAEMPIIAKNRLVEFGEGTKKVSYRHEDLAIVIETIKPVLHKHGLAHRFRTEHLDGGQIRVTCIITGHGHREETSLQSSRDTGAGRNDIQAIMSTVTYLERYTIKAALGLAASVDDDGRGSEGEPATISAIQLQQIEALAIEVKANVEQACKYLKINSMAELPAARFEHVMQLLEAKRPPL